jgi:hypothetical protein
LSMVRSQARWLFSKVMRLHRPAPTASNRGKIGSVGVKICHYCRYFCSEPPVLCGMA